VGIFKKQRTRKDIDLITEEKLYEYVANEIAAGEIRQGLWAKATAEADTSSEADIHKKYLKLRVEYLRAEGRLHEQFLTEATAAVDELESSEKRKPKLGRVVFSTPFDHPDGWPAWVKAVYVILLIGCVIVWMALSNTQ
jgi:hypothetical protein